MAKSEVKQSTYNKSLLTEKYFDKDQPIFSKCSLCDFQVEYSFRNKKILTHILNEHGDDSNGQSTYKCQKCGKELAKLR